MRYDVYKIEWFTDEYVKQLEEYNKLSESRKNSYMTYTNGNSLRPVPMVKQPEKPKNTYRTKEQKNPLKTDKIVNILSFSWKDDKNNIFSSFQFTSLTELDCGDWVCLYNSADDADVFIGVITQKSHSDLYRYSYSGYDLGFYLEKNEITIQFKDKDNVTISKAIKDVCERVGIECGYIEPVNITVKEIYKNKTASDILQDLYKKALTTKEKDGNRVPDVYYFDCKTGKLIFDRYKDTSEELKGYIANVSTLKSFDYIQDFNISSSIEEMKNSVQIYVNDTDNNTSKNTNKKGDKEETLPDKVYELKSNENIEKYGLLNHIEETDKEKNTAVYKQKARDLLLSLNKETENITIKVLGDYKLQKGLLVPLEVTKLNLKAYYAINNSEHTIEGTTERVRLEIEKHQEIN